MEDIDNTPPPETHMLARIAELEAALRPFAREADEYRGWIGSVMVEADEEGGTREAWYKISDIRHARDVLAHHTPLTEGERNAIIEGCALLIDKHVIQDTADGKRLVPRQDGNRDGMRYADGIRSMKCGTEITPQTHLVPVPALWAECAYCKEAGEEECLHPVNELRWNGERWCCEECGSGEEPDLWQSSPQIAIPAPQSREVGS